MPDIPNGEQMVVLSLLPPTRRERQWAFAACGISIVVFLALAPFARVPLPRIAAFIPCYESALVISDLITAALLFGQFAIGSSRGLLVLACGYLFTALTAIVHALSFPGLFAETGLLGAGPQSTAWLYMFWHGGFSVAVLGYAWLKHRHPARYRPLRAVLLCIAGVAALVAGATLLATAGAAKLPAIMQGDHYTPAMLGVCGAVWALSFLALAVLVLRRPHAVLDLWLIVVLCAWLCDIALSVVLNAGRFDLGFYAGRVYGLLAASCVLVVLLLETIALYAQLARSLQSERQERERRLAELHAQLVHLSRVSELGQMVSALAHEVNQPLTAIGNYLRAGQRLVAAGNVAALPAALDKASHETARASAIVRRLRDHLKKQESVRRPEELAPILEETVSLALVGARRDVQVAVETAPDASLALIDRIQIQQVLMNLIRNAIDATAEGPLSVLTGTASAAGGMVELFVVDDGPGLRDDVRERLFQPFVTTKPDGMGVGLSICQSIIEAHGGRIWAEDNPGGGTVFRFTVPAAAAALTAAD